MLWKYSPNLVDWDNSVSYVIHTKDVQQVEDFLVEFKILRFSFSMNTDQMYELAVISIWTFFV